MDVGRSRPFPGGLGVHCILEFIKYILHVAPNFGRYIKKDVNAI